MIESSEREEVTSSATFPILCFWGRMCLSGANIVSGGMQIHEVIVFTHILSSTYVGTNDICTESGRGTGQTRT
jgi:hypothetical protein